jgi:GWxTD domain-containing protein
MKATMRQLLLASVFLALLVGCGGSAPVATGDNYAHLYGKRSTGMRLQARVHHPAADRSVIYFKLNTADLLYKSAGGGPFRAQVLLKYMSYSGWDMKQLLDSASTYVKDQSDRPNEDKELIGSLEMRNTKASSYVILLTARDLNRDVESSLVIAVERGVGGRQDFLPMDQRGLPLFDDHVAAGSELRVMCEQHAGATLYAEHYKHGPRLPLPVFTEEASTSTPSPDSTFTLQVGPDGWFAYRADAHGFTHFRPDTARNDGYTVFVLDESYPTVSTAKDLVGPLRYITSGQEWDRITGSPEPRKEVERFWSDAAGDRERAREAIKAYYGRVENANRFFTGQTEGWKSDRGLVHIIFGTPNTIRRSERSETWIYGEETNLMSLVFTFNRRDGPFSGNDMVLRRDPQFKSAWYRNVESWRNGRVMQN